MIGIKRPTWAMLGFILVLAFLVIYPLVMVFYGSFAGGGPGTTPEFSLKGYRAAFSDIGNYKVLWNTLWLSVIRTLCVMALAIFLAWVVTRTNTPWSRGLEVLVWLVFIGLPLLPMAEAWIMLAGPNGFINQALKTILPFTEPLLNIYSYGGIIWVSTLFWASIAFILITPAFRGMDASLEESSRMSGASTLTTLRRITVPALAPTLLGVTLMVFIRLLESFEIELLLGMRNGIFVYTTRVWILIGTVPSDYPQGMALSTVFLAFIFGLIVLNWKLLGQKQYTTITGRGFAVRPTNLGRWKYTTLGLVLLYFVIAFALPFLTLILGSFMKVWGVWMEKPFTMANWILTIKDSRMPLSLVNTMLVSLGAATIGMFVYSIISYIVVKTDYSGKKVLDFISWLPYSVPSLVLALGFLWAYVGGIPVLHVLAGTIWIMMLAFIVRSMPLGCRVMNGSMYQVGKELEECSRSSGASWFTTFRRILVPILSPAFISTWIILFVIAMRDLVTIIFLYSAKSRVISVIFLENWIVGEYEKATVVGVIMTVLVLAGALIARRIGAKQVIAA